MKTITRTIFHFDKNSSVRVNFAIEKRKISIENKNFESNVVLDTIFSSSKSIIPNPREAFYHTLLFKMQNGLKKYFFFVFLALVSCVQDDDYKIPNINDCDASILTPTKTVEEIYNLTTSITSQYTEADVIEAYVTSNDQSGNFYNELHFQTLDGSHGFSIPVDVPDLYTIFNPGRKVSINLKNTFTQLNFESLEIGNLYVDERTKEESIGKITAANFKNVLVKTCDIVDEEQLVNKITLSQITDAHLNTLIELKDVQFEDAALGKTLYETNTDSGGGTNYLIEDISTSSISFRTSAFANFGTTEVPSGNGTIRGVLSKFSNTYQILIRSIEDVQLNNDRKRIGFAENISGTKASIAEIRTLFTGTDSKITDDIYIEGVITMSGIDENNMSDRNAFIQDESGAIALRFSSAGSLRSGYQVKINLKDVVLGSLRGLLQANITQYKHVLFVADNVTLPTPTSITIEDLNTGNYEAQLVRIDNVQFEEEEGTYKGSIPLTDCKKLVDVLTVSTATFANEEYPTGNGTIIGIASTYTDPVLLLKNIEATVNMTATRCVPTGDITNKVFISEIADPDNNANARFIEIYNADSKPIDLTAWTLNRYTNDSETISSSMDLTGITLAVDQAFVIAVNDVEFEAVYGFAPNMDGTSTGPAGSNGDDNITLVDPNGTIIDIFGVIGEDGTNTNHEFEDGRALRNASVTQGNSVYTFSEWQIWNDTGAVGTTKLPQNAPDDFTPGVR
ncbi:lamin tail domain-containing protein [Aureibaculum sp. A20]|uniref:Lamin tail domain-containing protein n=1 Tax=Aureibaculum flavum TaxID=2795986 RepID=A0ABS0WQ02_9FLAO|nr:DUF5689 domain-containing protein [Aureibaculum flavum]MBJ2174055.1 lamin tail domain-containing protein [Aureibaculum flavum]